MENSTDKAKIAEISGRFQEAVRTLHRLPRVSVKSYFNAWPQIIRTPNEILAAEVLPTRLGPPSTEKITRMEETIQWIFLLDDEDERRIVWLRAENVPWRKICERIGCGRTKAWQLWHTALLKIATRLENKRNTPRNTPRNGGRNVF